MPRPKKHVTEVKPKRPYVRKVPPVTPEVPVPKSSRPCDAHYVTTIDVDHSFAHGLIGMERGYRTPVQAIVDFCATMVCLRFEPLIRPDLVAGRSPAPLGLTKPLPITAAVLDRLTALGEQLGVSPAELLRESYLILRKFFERKPFPSEAEFIMTKGALHALRPKPRSQAAA